MSAFSSGPSTASRRPNAALITLSTVSRIADAVLDQRHRLAPQGVLQPVADEAGHVLLHMRRLLAGGGVQLHGEVDRLRRSSIASRSPRPAAPGRAGSTNGCRARARAAASPCMIVGDRDDRGVAGEDRVGPHVLLDLGEQFLLQRQVLQHGLDDVVGLAHRRAEIGDRRHPLDRALVVAEVLQVGEDARLGAVEAGLDRVVMVTSWPASANTWAMPWPISPAPMTAMRGLLMCAASHACPGRSAARSDALQTRDPGFWP